MGNTRTRCVVWGEDDAARSSIIEVIEVCDAKPRSSVPSKRDIASRSRGGRDASCLRCVAIVVRSRDRETAMMKQILNVWIFIASGRALPP